MLNECYRLGPSCRCVPWTNVQCQDHITDSRGGLSVGLLGFGRVGVEMAQDARCGVAVFWIRKCVCFPPVRELVCVSAGVPVENELVRIVTGDVQVKAHSIAADVWVGARGVGTGCGATGRVTTPVGGTEG